MSCWNDVQSLYHSVKMTYDLIRKSEKQIQPKFPGFHLFCNDWGRSQLNSMIHTSQILPESNSHLKQCWSVAFRFEPLMQADNGLILIFRQHHFPVALEWGFDNQPKTSLFADVMPEYP